MGAELLFIAGFMFGIAVGGSILWWRSRDLARIYAQREADLKEQFSTQTSAMKDSFSTLSLEALSQNTEHFLKLAQEKFTENQKLTGKELDARQSTVNTAFKQMKDELEKVQKTVTDLEKDRQQKFGELTNQLKATTEQTEALRQTTQGLHQALSSSQSRGQWGERMAEDVLRLAGMVEGVNYIKQGTIAQEEGSISRPDYTFYLPQGRVVHMDVKFPLDNYMLYLNAADDTAREQAKKKFIDDAKKMINDVTKRSYVDSASGTLDYMLVFVPNEQVYAFLNEHNRDLIESAMSKKIILCSPMTLFAVLSVIHKAVESFDMEQRAAEVQKVLIGFKQQWEKFTEHFDKMGKKIQDAQDAFNTLTGTRKNMLERQLNKLDNLEAPADDITEHVATPTGNTKPKVLEVLETTNSA